MPAPDTDLIPGIRATSRDLVRLWGFLNRSVAGTDLSGSAVHALIEIGQAGRLNAAQLCDRLLLEKSSVSRLVRALVERGLVQEDSAAEDRRVKGLTLTADGRRVLAGVDAHADAQVAAALARLDGPAQGRAAAGMADYARALAEAAELPAGRPPFDIRRGHVPGLLGRAVELMTERILREYPFGAAFDAKVGSEMASFMLRADAPQNGIWHAWVAGRIVGTITIDGENLGDNRAHLRWFVVADAAQGSGIGRALLNAALEHCDDRGFDETQLWTVQGLDAARRLYERNGFHLAEEWQGDQWGAAVVEQRFVRPRGAG